MQLCPGSRAAEKDLPDIIVADDGEEGTLIHDALADDIAAYSKLSSDQMTVFEEMNRKAIKVAETHGFDHYECESHRRFWFDNDFSGEVDRIYRQDTRALICDFKCGFLPVTESARNPQLATLAVLAIKNLYVAEVIVQVIPRIGKMPEPAIYDLEAANAAYGEIQNIIADAAKPDAPRVAGDKQCKYCRFRTQCPEFGAYASVALAVKKADLPSLPADRLALALDRIPAANDLIKALKAEAKRRLAEGDEEFSKLYTLTEGRDVRTVVNLPTLFEKVKELGVTVDDFTANCSMDIGGVEKGVGRGLKGIIHASTGAKGKALDEKTAELLVGCVETNTTAGSLKRIEAAP